MMADLERWRREDILWLGCVDLPGERPMLVEMSVMMIGVQIPFLPLFITI